MLKAKSPGEGPRILQRFRKYRRGRLMHSQGRQKLKRQLNRVVSLAWLTYASCLALMALGMMHWSVASARSEPQASPSSPIKLAISIEAEAVQPAGAPLLLTAGIKNSSDRPWHYWVPSREVYPAARSFTGRITDAQGRAREIDLSNDQDGGISGRDLALRPGATVKMPAALPPQVPGTYTIEFTASHGLIVTSNRVEVEISKDAQLLTKWEGEIRKKVLAGDHGFAWHLARRYATEGLRSALLRTLLDDDPEKVSRAAYPLSDASKLPTDAGPIICEAIRKQMAVHAKLRNIKGDACVSLAFLAARVGSDAALDSVLALAHSDQHLYARPQAVVALALFPQARATEELHSFLKDKQEEVRFRTAQALSKKKDPAALEVLLAIARNPRSDYWTGYAYMELVNYPDDPRVETALIEGLKARDSFVRESAKIALRDLRRKRKA